MDLIDLIKQSKKTMVLTGAGMSTESGLKDFRSNGGLWAGKDPMEIASTRTIQPARAYETWEQYIGRLREFQSFYTQRIEEVLKHKPNRGHEILAEWQRKGYVHTIATQNVDGYHQRAGSQDVIELHGTLMSARCNTCGKSYTVADFMVADVRICNCTKRGGIVRPNIVLFGEDLSEAYEQALEAARQSDLIIVIGTSLAVSPVNYLPMEALRKGSKLAIINRDATPFDHLAVVNLRTSIGHALEYIDQRLSKNL